MASRTSPTYWPYAPRCSSGAGMKILPSLRSCTIQATIRNVRHQGLATLSRFNASPEQMLWYFARIAQALDQHRATPRSRNWKNRWSPSPACWDLHSPGLKARGPGPALPACGRRPGRPFARGQPKAPADALSRVRARHQRSGAAPAAIRHGHTTFLNSRGQEGGYETPSSPVRCARGLVPHRALGPVRALSSSQAHGQPFWTPDRL
jgi:hypothetical protein